MIANFHDPTNCRMYERRHDPVVDFVLGIPAGSCFIDVGANQGETTVLASGQVGDKGLVLAFEPGQHAFGLLKKNVELNQLKNVLLRNMAISSDVGDLRLSTDDPDHSAIAHISARGEPVRAGPLDDPALLDRISRMNVYIKIDTEGYELQVMRGLKDILSSGRVRALVVEIDDRHLGRYSSSPEEVYLHLEKYGFSPRNGLKQGHYDEVFEASDCSSSNLLN